MIVAVVAVYLIQSRPIEPLWGESLMIVLAHYFTSRRFINLSPDVIRRLEAEGHIQREFHPLYLPRHSIRVVIVGTFAALAVYLYRENRLFQPDALVVLGVIFAYVLGIVARGVRTWWTRGRPSKFVRWWEDVKAVVVIVVLGYTVVAFVSNHPEWAPTPVPNITLGLVLFYFGSR
jgi:hypothetical protein